MVASVDAPPWERGPLGFLRRHPVLFLLLLSPGIPEYLSGSSPVKLLLFNPFVFFVFLAGNLGLYGPGVLLVREATIRWKKGWATTLILGGAYGILEEGLALSTLFDPKAGPAGALGTYGHWLGVSWVWVAEAVPFHSVFSISIPILLLGLAVPATRGQPLLPGRKCAAAVAILVVDVVCLMAFVYAVTGFWMGFPILVGSMVAISALILAGRKSGSVWPRKLPGPPRWGLAAAFLIGLFFFPGLVVILDVVRLFLPALVTLVIVLLYQAGYLFLVVGTLGFEGNQRHEVFFVWGAVGLLFLDGLVVNFPYELVLLVDVGLVLLFVNLLKMYPEVARAEVPPAKSKP